MSLSDTPSAALSRRNAIVSFGSLSLLGCAPRAHAAAPTASPGLPSAKGGAHQVRPLPFDATKLSGLSERMLVSHHDNNYAGAVKNLNRVEGELARINKDTPPFVVSGLKQSELTFRNSALLHELYFANLGGSGSTGSVIEKAFADADGTFATWEERFRAIGASLGGGSGWVITGYDLLRDALYTTWSGNHTQLPGTFMPLLVMDMYEHAYQIDYGAAAAKYIDAFFKNVHWEEVQRRFERAQKAAAALRRS